MANPTTNMGMTKPTVGTSTYPSEVDADYETLDNHDHTTGKGKLIPTGGITDGAVTQVKLQSRSNGTGAGGISISSSSAGYSSTATVATDVTNLTASLTTTGRPVFIQLIGDVGVNSSFFQSNTASAINVALDTFVNILRASTVLVQYQLRLTKSAAAATGFTFASSPSSINFLDVVAAGTYTYKIQAFVDTANTTLFVTNCKLVVWEI